MQVWEKRVHVTGATVAGVVEIERILKQAIILWGIAGEVIYISGNYQASRWKPIELIVHNGHVWQTTNVGRGMCQGAAPIFTIWLDA